MPLTSMEITRFENRDAWENSKERTTHALPIKNKLKTRAHSQGTQTPWVTGLVNYNVQNKTQLRTSVLSVFSPLTDLLVFPVFKFLRWWGLKEKKMKWHSSTSCDIHHFTDREKTKLIQIWMLEPDVTLDDIGTCYEQLTLQLVKKNVFCVMPYHAIIEVYKEPLPTWRGVYCQHYTTAILSISVLSVAAIYDIQVARLLIPHLHCRYVLHYHKRRVSST